MNRLNFSKVLFPRRKGHWPWAISLTTLVFTFYLHKELAHPTQFWLLVCTWVGLLTAFLSNVLGDWWKWSCEHCTSAQHLFIVPTVLSAWPRAWGWCSELFAKWLHPDLPGHSTALSQLQGFMPRSLCSLISFLTYSKHSHSLFSPTPTTIMGFDSKITFKPGY